VLANGSMSSNQSGEDEIRKNIIEEDLVDCMAALPDKLFYSTQIPACLWFLARDKSGKGGFETCPYRDRRGQVLFIDARRMGRMVDRTHRELTDEDIAKIANTYHAGAGTRTPANTGTSPASARALRWRRSASTATCSRQGAMSVHQSERRTTNRSTKRCNGWWCKCGSSRQKPGGSMRQSGGT